jgi:undecaprenyl-diphosphatase
MKDKREIQRSAGFRWWQVVFFGGGILLLLASFYFDITVVGWMKQHQTAAMGVLMRGVSRWTDWPQHVTLGLVLLALAFWRGNKKWMRIFAAMILACALAGAVTRVIKISAGRARPTVQTEARWSGPRFSSAYNAFPSGHTAASTAFFATLALASWRIGRFFVAVPLLVAFSRMYVAAHYLSDVVGAALLGVVAAYYAWRFLFRPIENRKSQIGN